MRTKDSQKKKNNMKMLFIKSGACLIDQKGISSFSIRNVAKACDYNSATIYNYFDSASQLFSLSLLYLVKDYFLYLKENVNFNNPSYLDYLQRWRDYATFAFRRSDIYSYIFYSEHSKTILKELPTYFELFYPDIDINSVEMKHILGKSIFDRDQSIMKPMVEENLISKNEQQYILDLSYALELGMAANAKNKDDIDQWIYQYMEYLVDFLLLHSKISKSKDEIMKQLFKN